MRTRDAFTIFRLGSLWLRLRSSLWVVPIACVACALASALLLPLLDRRLGGEHAWYLYAGQPDGARELLSTIASSMLTLAGLVFSITILVLQLASSQFSPRVLRTFMADRTTQLSMGIFLGSFVYAMVLLPQVRGGPAESEFVPALAVFVAVVLVLVSVVMFVLYIHHMAHSIRAVHVLRSVAEDAHAAIAALYPDVGHDDPVKYFALPTRTPDQCIANGQRAGVVTALDAQELMRLACAHDAFVALAPSIGDFVPRGAPLFSVWGERKIEEADLCECVVLEEERTPAQDAAFGLRQLVDVAARALSPGVNDPSTAVQALDYVHDLLRALAVRKIPVPLRFDDEQRLRLRLPCPDWSAYVQLGLNEVRQYGGRSIQVMRRMRSLLQDLLTLTDASRAAVLHEQLRLLDLQIGHSFEEKAERTLVRTANGARHETLPTLPRFESEA